MLIKRKFKARIPVTLFLLLLACTGDAQVDSTRSNEIKGQSTNAQKGVTVTGTITDAMTKKGLAGIHVSVKDFSAAITDSTGNFSLKSPSYTSSIIIEGEGYDTRSIPLKGRQSVTVALLDETHESFNQPVTMPMGIRNRSEVTASIGRYPINSAWGSPAEMTDGILQGRITGLNVVRRSGAPGVGANCF